MNHNPALVALADQFTAHATQTLADTVDAMRQLLNLHPPNIEIELAGMACILSTVCENDEKDRDNLIANYVMAIYELAQK